MCAKMAFLNELELKIEARTPTFSFQICNLHPLKYQKTKIWSKTNEPFCDDQKTLNKKQKKNHLISQTIENMHYYWHYENLSKML